MLAIIHAELILRDHYLPDAVLFAEDGKITGFGEMRSTPIPEGCEILDAQGLYVGPGLVDIHTHAGGRYSFGIDCKSAAIHHLQHGTTSVLPTFAYSRTREQILHGLELTREALLDPRCGNIAGVYMEGPYLNPSFGAAKYHMPWAKPIDRKDYQEIIDAAQGLARVWSVAPEREGTLEFMLDVKKSNPEAVFTVGHSEATPQQIEALIPYGLCIGTHHTNATGTIEKYPECRGVCVDEAVNYSSAIYAELISDCRGIHVDPYMQRLVRKIKGDDRIILITDATAAGAEGRPVVDLYEGVTDINFDQENEISGTRMTLSDACRNFMKHTGASLVDVFKMASYNPANVVGLRDRGEIAVGKRADLIVTDGHMNVRTVILQGKVL